MDTDLTYPPQRMHVALIDDAPLARPGEHGSALGDMAGLALGLAHIGHHADVYLRAPSHTHAAVIDLHPDARVHLIPSCMDERDTQRVVADFATQVKRLVLSAEPCDVVHAGSGSYCAGLAGLCLQRSQQLPFVLSYMRPGAGRVHMQGDGLDQGVKRLLEKSADAIVVHDPCDDDEIERMAGRSAYSRSVVHVPSGVDVDRFRPMDKNRARQALGLPTRAFIVMGDESLETMMSWVPTAAGFTKKLAKLTDHLLISSRASLRTGRLSALARESQRDVVVHWVDPDDYAGHPDDLMRLCYAAADVLLVGPGAGETTAHPGQALACGTPALVAADSGWAMAVEDGLTGYVLETPDWDLALRRLGMLKRQPDWMRTMRMASVFRARSLFAWDKIAWQVQHVYGDVRPGARQSFADGILQLVSSRPTTVRHGPHGH